MESGGGPPGVHFLVKKRVMKAQETTLFRRIRRRTGTTFTRYTQDLRAYLKLHRGKAIVAGIIAGLAVVIPGAVLGSNMLIETVDSPAFCTQACHAVHYPEAVAFEASPHSQVTCASCHVGAGSENLVRSKLRGLNDILPTITGKYERPIPTPLTYRRPSTETCEKCHWSEKFFGDVPRITTSYNTDEANSKQTHTRVMRVNGGKPEVATGIHWHATAKVWYLPVDDRRMKIAWAGVEDPSGSITEYIAPDLIDQITPERVQQGERFMDCMDCHNRVTHLFRSPDELIDKALGGGSIDINLPFIKREGLSALVPQSPNLAEADRKIDKIKEFYQTTYPAIFENNEASIDAALDQLKEIARLTTFDDLDWNTYPDHSAHIKPDDNMQVDFEALATKRDSPGCFRCHGTLLQVNDTQSSNTEYARNGSSHIARAANDTATGQVPGASTENAPTPARWLDAECNSCHYTAQDSATSPLAPAVSHPTDGLDNCLACHSPTSSRPFKSDHPWATNAACTSCHESAPKLKSFPATEMPAEAKPITHAINRLDDCLTCHGPTGVEPISVQHPWATSDTCLACHQSASTLKPQPKADPPVGANLITHSINKLDDCLSCHGPGGPQPFSSNHPWATSETCLACHKMAPTIKPLPKDEPPADVRPITHSINNVTECLICHGPAGPQPFSKDHPWATDQNCTACHKMASNLKPFPLAEPPSDAMTIPHPTVNLEQCLACHGPSAPQPFPRSHPWATNDTCTACHKPATAASTTALQTLPQAPDIAHSIAGLDACTSCHSQSGAVPYPSDHVGRTDKLCTICHKPRPNLSTTTSTLPTGVPIPHPTAGMEDCLLCHSPSGPVPYPSNHAGRPDTLCLICHKPGSQSPPPSVPPPSTPPPVTPPPVTPAPGTPTPGTPPPPTPTPAPAINAAALYSSNCAVCHGANRQRGIGPALTTTAMASRSLTQITNAIANGVGSMPGYSKTLTSAQISALAQFLKSTPP